MSGSKRHVKYWLTSWRFDTFPCRRLQLENQYICWALQRTNSTQRPGSPKNTTQQHDVSVQSTLDRRPMYYSQKQKWTRRVRMQTQ